MDLIHDMSQHLPDQSEELQKLAMELAGNREPGRKEVLRALHQALILAGDSFTAGGTREYYQALQKENAALYNTHLYHEGARNILRVEEEKPVYDEDSPVMNGYEILNKFFDELFTRNPKVVAFGEDLGKIGDVNQGFAGLQARHGADRIFDTGIRELTIMGQGIGMAIRGLRPIAEIQYIDYLLYGLQPLSDDLASLQYRTAGKQTAPLIVRTRGHRLEGIWHSGSPMGMVINSLRGLHICVPRRYGAGPPACIIP